MGDDTPTIFGIEVPALAEAVKERGEAFESAIANANVKLSGMKLADDEILILHLQGPEADETLLTHIRDQLRKNLGEGRVLVMGTDDDLNVQMATIKAPPTQLNVRVGGAEVYRAVKNYIKTNEVLHEKVKEAVQETISSGAVNNQLLYLVRQHFSAWGSERKLAELMKNVITDELKQRMEEEITKAVEKVLERAVFVMPPKGEGKTAYRRSA